MTMFRIHRVLVVVLLAGCPGGGAGDDTGTTAEPASTSVANPTSGTSSTSSDPTTSGPTASTSSTGGGVDTGTSSGGGTTGDGTTGDGTTGDSTTGDGTTFDGTTFDTGGPVDPSCTYPGSTSDGPVSPDLAPECACIDGDGNLLCAASLCPTISGTCDGIDFDDACHDTWNYNVEALDCALVAARDGAEGTIDWYFSANGGYSLRQGFLHIVPDRRAIRQDDHKVDLGGTVTDTELWQLKDAAYFQGCLDLPTFCMRLHCFFAGTEGDSLSLCLPSFDYDDF